MAKKAGKATETKSKLSNVSEFSQPKKRRAFTVFLVIDERSTRETLASALKEHQIEVQDYMTAMEFYRDYRTPVPGLLLTEIHLRGMTGLELHDKLAADKSDLMVALIAGHAEAPTAVRAMQAGVVDFLPKPIQVDAVIELIARAYAMYYDVDWDFVGEDLDDVERNINRITGREREVLDLVVQGLSSREISLKLDISVKTVEAHRAHINDKMRANDLAHLVRMVMAYQEDTAG
jgi:FixJ family two-component response regulator